jgi:hypothetical protein
MIQTLAKLIILNTTYCLKTTNLDSKSNTQSRCTQSKGGGINPRLVKNWNDPASTSRYDLHMFMVSKKDGSLRVVQDLRELNAASHDDRYLMKTANE